MTIADRRQVIHSLALFLAVTACTGERDAIREVDSASVTQPAERSDTASVPRIERRADTLVLALPAEMEGALLAAIPGFRHWRITDYVADLATYFPPTASSALFAVIGDMNGDRRTDVIIDGHDSTRALVVALMTERDSVHVVTVKESPLRPTRERGPRATFLTLAPRGVIRADTIDDDRYDRIPVTIEHDGFEISYYQKAASLYYWRDGRFLQWITSD